MVGLDRVEELVRRESGLAVAFVYRADGTGVASVVNAGIIDHPLTDDRLVGFVARGGARKLAHLRERPRITVVFRSGWEWAAVEGDALLVGHDDPLDGVEPSDVAGILRAVYAAAVGGTDDDWAEMDDTMAAEGHTAVLIVPGRIYANPA
jgi:hypothetical protein